MDASERQSVEEREEKQEMIEGEKTPEVLMKQLQQVKGGKQMNPDVRGIWTASLVCVCVCEFTGYH